MTWAPTPHEAALLATGDAITYRHDDRWEVVRLDALPKELATYVRQQERAEALKVQREAQRFLKRSPR